MYVCVCVLNQFQTFQGQYIVYVKKEVLSGETRTLDLINNCSLTTVDKLSHFNRQSEQDPLLLRNSKPTI